MTSMMKAVVVEANGGPENLLLKDWPLPQAKENEVVIKNHISAVNFMDIYQREGTAPTSLPYIVGNESVGKVYQVGKGVTKYKEGDRVISVGSGSHCEYTLASQATNLVIKIPDGISDELAVTVGVAGITAWMLIRIAQVQKGDHVLVHAAAGGTGIILVQLLKYIGANVIGVVSTEEKAEILHEHGIDHVVVVKTKDDYKKVLDKVNDITHNRGCEVVLDSVGKDSWETSMAAVRNFGTFVIYGYSSGLPPSVNFVELCQKNIKYVAPSAYVLFQDQEEERRELWLDEFFTIIGKGHIRPHIHKKYTLEDVAQAHIDLASRKTSGKLLIQL
ncbi:uncharacterized protein BX664DRAFT_328682 [Halteromyces radiatus]|uniref:uncharacterized protein n=1 Tax=Halteromyces radiatus TaxID=101107 RepID=UPI00221F2BB7|nr:uncharacterized protein BX664DRAFT_328682 [Halteromyces radiatus]KAI8092992.1 hypothetical protein BX664DRAFT_328682 [Halteromyces radiatus]